MNHYLRNLYLVKSDPALMQSCIQILEQYCKTLNEYTSCDSQTHYKKTPMTPPRVLWISESAPNYAFVTHIQPKHYRQILGQEFSLIIYDVAAGIRANPWYAVIGTLQLGGVMLLLCPTTDIASLPSALPMSYSEVNCADTPISTSGPSYVSHFNVLFADLFSKYFPNQILINTSQLEDCLTRWQQIQTQRLSESLPVSVTKQLQLAINDQASVGKQLVNNLLSQHLADKKPNIYLLQADRGRGKSDLLGQLPGLLLQASTNDAECRFTQIIYITQSNEASRTIRNGLYRFRDHLIGLENRTDNIGPIHVRFCAPDDPSLFAQTNEQNTRQTLLLVDEAASLPVYWLQQALAHYSSIVFATTTHGYENNGMGFSLTFLPSLDHYATHQLTHPIRFIGQCPLESFAARLLTPHNSSKIPIHLADGLHMLNHEHLMAQSELRSAVMACLMEAHYQTAPDDLQRLLDAPDMQCGIFIQQGQLIGCVWIVQEGRIDDQELQQNIAQGSRRVNGHLSAQQLAYTYGDPTMLTQNIWRINRISVLPQYQDRGFGTQILSALLEQAKAAKIDMITSAFGASERLLKFWQFNHYQIVKKGQQINSVTGLVNAIVRLPISDNVNLQHINEWYSIVQQWHQLIASTSHIEKETLKIASISHPALTHHSQLRLKEFLDGTRSFDYAEMYIYWFMQTYKPTKALEAQHLFLLQQRFIKGLPLNALISRFELANKKALINAIKTALRALL